jgi:hypothetical protein
MPRRSGRESKPTPKGIKYRQEVEVKKSKAKTRRKSQNVRREQRGKRPILAPIEEDEYDMGKLADKFNTMKLGARRKTRRSRK